MSVTKLTRVETLPLSHPVTKHLTVILRKRLVISVSHLLIRMQCFIAYTWLYRYGPETKQQSMEWRHSGSPRPKTIRVQKFAGKVLASNFLGSRRHPPH